jgi:hypothetical protein
VRPYKNRIFKYEEYSNYSVTKSDQCLEAVLLNSCIIFYNYFFVANEIDFVEC